MSQQYPQDRDPGRQPQPGYSQRDYVQPHVHKRGQQHVPEQWQGKPSYGRQATPANWPPEVGYWTYPGITAKPQPRRPPFPSHRTGFPWELLGFSSGRRSRGPSFFQVLYLGTHPVALLMSVFLIMITVGFWFAWVAFVVIFWLLWCLGVTIGWGCQAVAFALRGHRGRL